MMLDPYAVLGIAPGSSMAEVKRAYRRMAKAFHPDSAGDAAIPKFLAIHEAYEAIVESRPMRPETAASWRRASRAWAADPARTGATRTSRTSRQGAPDRGSPAGGPAKGPAGAASDTAGAGPTRGRTGPRPAGEPSSRRRSTRKATLGSTSYDDAVQEPFEPEWEGASWYGRASGTYWTINPKEYADPRKHGPEYQERARRATRGASAGGAGEPGPESETWVDAASTAGTASDANAADLQAARQRAAAEAQRRARFDASETSRAHAAAAAASRTRMSAADRVQANDPFAPPPGAQFEAWIRALFAARDLRMRLLLAAVGWPPLGVLAASIISQLTGCAAFSVACEPPDDLLPLAAGAALYALLVAVPTLARLSASGTIAILLTAIPVAAFVVTADVPQGRAPDAVLALAIFGLAWLVGMVAVLVGSRGRILRA